MIYRWTVFSAVLAGLLALVVLESPWLAASSAQRTVERVQGYVVGGGIDPVLALPGADEWLRLVVYPVGSEDEERAVEIDILRPGEAVETRRYALEVAEPDVEEPSAFDHQGTTIGAAQRIDVVFDPPLRNGTRLALKAEGGIVWVRASSWQPNPAPERLRRRLETVPEARGGWMAAYGLRSWDHADAAEQERAASHRFAPLAASGRAGVDHRAVSFFVRGGARPAPLPAARPVRLLTWVLPASTEHALRLRSRGTSVPVTVWVWRGGLDQEHVAEWILGAAVEERSIQLPSTATPETFVLQVEPPVPLDVWLTGPSLVEPAGHTVWATPLGAQEVAVLDVDRPHAPVGRAVEVEWWGDGTVAATQLTFDTDGAVHTASVDLPENRYDGVVGADGVERPVRGPGRVRVSIPPGTKTLAVRADAAGWMRFRIPNGPPPEVAPARPAVRWIGDPDADVRASWAAPLAPTRLEPVRVKGRLEPVSPPAAPVPGLVATAVEPSTFAMRGQVLEPAPAGEDASTQVDGAVRVVATDRARAELMFEVHQLASLGTTLSVRVDGQEIGPVQLAMSRGTLPLPPLASGIHTIEARPPDGVFLRVTLPPAPGETARTFRERSVFRADRPIDVWVRTDQRGPRAVDVVVYDPSASPSSDFRIIATVDGGTPRLRASGTLTRATAGRRILTLPASVATVPAELVDGSRTAIGLPRTVVVPLGDDLAPGLHRVTLAPSRPTWLRVFAMLPPGAPRPAGPKATVASLNAGVEP